MSNLMVIDGNALVNVNFYGAIPEEIRSAFYALKDDVDQKNDIIDKIFEKDLEGNFIELLPSITQQILRYKDTFECDKLLVVFDRSREKIYRKSLLPDYKAQRSVSPKVIGQTASRLPFILRDMGIRSAYDENGMYRKNGIIGSYEADDLAGSVIETLKSQCDHVYFVTVDHDWLQLIDDNVTGLIIDNSKAAERQALFAEVCPTNQTILESENSSVSKLVAYNKEVCKQVEGVLPEQIPLLKALMGDTSDNYKGLPGVGEKAATTLIQNFGTVEGIYENIDNEELMKSLKIRKNVIASLKEHKEELENLFLPIATIQKDVMVVPPDKIDVLTCKTTKEDLENAAKKYNFYDKMKEFELQQE